MSNGFDLDAVTEIPKIETPGAVADLATEMETEALKARTIAPKMESALEMISAAIAPMKWLGFDTVSLEKAKVELKELLQ